MAAPSTPPAPPMRVLIAEDEALIRLDLREIRCEQLQPMSRVPHQVRFHKDLGHNPRPIARLTAALEESLREINQGWRGVARF